MVGLRGAAAGLIGLHAAASLGFSNQPVCAHEGDELCKGHYNTQESPEHRATGDNDMTHIAVQGGKRGVHGVNKKNKPVGKEAQEASEGSRCCSGYSLPQPGAPFSQPLAAPSWAVMLPCRSSGAQLPASPTGEKGGGGQQRQAPPLQRGRLRRRQTCWSPKPNSLTPCALTAHPSCPDCHSGPHRTSLEQTLVPSQHVAILSPFAAFLCF